MQPKITVVEDEEAVRNLAVRILEKYGYEVLKAGGGLEAEAVSQTYDGQIDLLLSDVIMPRASGKETAEKVKESRPNIKVLYMSGYTDDVIAHHGVLDSDTNFIEKPFSADSLGAKVRAVLVSK